MTWYAQQLIADAVPALADDLRAQPAFARGLYHVKDLQPYRKVEREVVEVEVTADGGREVTASIEHGPRLPPAGLLFVRELCEAEKGDHASGWFGDDAISWTVADREGPALEIDRDRVIARLDGHYALPPAALLREAKRLSIAHGASITYFATFFWGGDQERAIGWVFDGAGGEVVYTQVGDDDRGGPGDHVWAWRLDPRGERRITQGDVLTLALLHHGLQICHSFPPHMRGFRWDDHRQETGLHRSPAEGRPRT